MDPNLFFQTITSHLGDINIAASDLGIRWVKLNSEHKNDNHPNHHIIHGYNCEGGCIHWVYSFV